MTPERLAEIRATLLQIKHEMVRANWFEAEIESAQRLMVTLSNAVYQSSDLHARLTNINHVLTYGEEQAA